MAILVDLDSDNEHDEKDAHNPPNKNSESYYMNSINAASAGHNASMPLSSTPKPVWESSTIAPSPPAPAMLQRQNTDILMPLDIAQHRHFSSGTTTPHSATAGLKIRTDLNAVTGSHSNSRPGSGGSDVSETQFGSQPINIGGVKRTPSIKQVLAEGSLSRSYSGSTPNSLLSSPQLNALPDITPLPSPIMGNGSPGLWTRRGSQARRISKPRSIEFTNISADEISKCVQSGALHDAIVNHKRRQYHGLQLTSEDATNGSHSNNLRGAGEANKDNYAKGHGRNRSQSEYHAGPIIVAKPRNQTVSGTHANDPTILELEAEEKEKEKCHMRREPRLAAQRGIASIDKPPTPPSSRTSRKEEESDSDTSATGARAFVRAEKRDRQRDRNTYFDAYTLTDNKKRRWRALKPLGEGTFSKVILATSQLDNEDNRIDEESALVETTSIAAEPEMDRKKLVAIKICEHGPKGGANEERVRLQLKRELELMKELHHPSLINLRAFNEEETRMLLVLGYCPGGDLFDIASERSDLLRAPLLKRMFAETVTALKYLHDRGIVHRDVKLENVLVNLPPPELVKPHDWTAYPHPVITLTDLGLARMVTPGEKLTTRCGSDDYAAPEVIMGQPYDGREVDAWSLGVLLYTLLELRLPFDPLPGAQEAHRQRSRTSHRVARVEWRWVKYAGEDGDHEGDFAMFAKAGLDGPREVVERLLRRARSRWTIDKLAELDWVKATIPEGGLQYREEEHAEVVGGDVVEEEAVEGAAVA